MNHEDHSKLPNHPLQCPNCQRPFLPAGREVVKCLKCRRWIEVVAIHDTGSVRPSRVLAARKYFRTKRNYRGDISATPTQVELLVELCRELGFKIPFRAWKFERVRAGHWQRSAGAWSWRIFWLGGECGSQWSVGQCLRDGMSANVD
jgi:hypothetical protein